MCRFSIRSYRLFSLSPPGEVKQEGGSVFREGTPYQRRGSLQLWQFLVALLDDPGNAHFIAWTGRGMEFKLIEPEEVSRRRRCGGEVSSFRASALRRRSGTDGTARFELRLACVRYRSQRVTSR